MQNVEYKKTKYYMIGIINMNIKMKNDINWGIPMIYRKYQTQKEKIQGSEWSIQK